MQKLYYFGKNGLNFKLKHRNTQKSILSGTGDLVTCKEEQGIGNVSKRVGNIIIMVSPSYKL